MRRVVVHYDPKRRIFMETADAEDGVDMSTPSGRIANPGHSIEVSWFLLHLCRILPSQKHFQMALDALEGALELGWDFDGGGGIWCAINQAFVIMCTTVTHTRTYTFYNLLVFYL